MLAWIKLFLKYVYIRIFYLIVIIVSNLHYNKIYKKSLMSLHVQRLVTKAVIVKIFA